MTASPTTGLTCPPHRTLQDTHEYNGTCLRGQSLTAISLHTF